MSARVLPGLAAFGLTVLLAGSVSAQTDHMHLGFRANYDATNKDLGLGVQFGAPLSRHLEFYPSADFYFVDVGSAWQANFDLKYRFRAEPPMWFYVGGGLGVESRTVNHVNSMNAGLNVLAGFEPLKGDIHPFIEARLTAADETRMGLAVGLNFTLGKARP